MPGAAAGASTSRTANAAAATNTLGILVKLALVQFYALGGYVLAYCSHLMWLDALILMPIVIWGLRSVMDGRGGKLYVTALACLLSVNYYLGLMVCLFVVFYFFVYYFGERKSGLGRILARVAALSLLSGMAAAIVLVPMPKPHTKRILIFPFSILSSYLEYSGTCLQQVPTSLCYDISILQDQSKGLQNQPHQRNECRPESRQVKHA